MIAWPEKTRAREIADAEEVEAPFSDGKSGPAVDVDLATPPPGSGPEVEPLARPHQTAPAHSVGLALALLVSVAVHAAVIAYLGERTARSGLEAVSGAVSLEIVFEAPPSRQVAGTDLAAASPEIADAPEMPESAVNPEQAEAPIAKPIEEPPVTDVPDTPSEAEASVSAALNDSVEQPAEVAPAAEEEPPVHSAEALPEQAADTMTTVLLPQEDVPLPTPRPEPPQVKRQAKALAQTQVKAKPAPRKQTAERKEPTARKAAPARQAAAPAAGRQGGATAGEEKAYGRRLARHVERHKRYPREAARQGIAGDAGLSITIDRQGRLAGARLSRPSGHPLLDEAALATARRASPYPSLPQGFGGSTYTFTLTLRFSR